jgi:hypothetical protein
MKEDPMRIKGRRDQIEEITRSLLSAKYDIMRTRDKKSPNEDRMRKTGKKYPNEDRMRKTGKKYPNEDIMRNKDRLDMIGAHMKTRKNNVRQSERESIGEMKEEIGTKAQVREECMIEGLREECLAPVVRQDGDPDGNK